MKTLLLVSALVFISLSGQAQDIVRSQLFPANASANDNLKLALDVQWSQCGRSFDYSFTQSGNTIAVRACTYGPALAIGCIKHDTIQLGRLPAGVYSIVITRYLGGFNPTNCVGSTPYGSPVTVNITVGTALATRLSAARWQFAPTVVPATAATLYLTGAPALQQAAIYDMTGREKARIAGSALLIQNNTIQVPLPQLEPALYLLRITDQAGQTSTQRFIRQ